MKKIHSLLNRQIKKFLPEELRNNDSIKKFIDAVNDAYFYSDDDRKLMERSLELNSQELLEFNSQLRALFKALPDYLIIIDSDGKVIDFKVGRENSLKIKPEKIIGRHISDTIYSKFTDLLFKHIKKVLNYVYTDILNVEFDFLGQKYFFEFRFTPLKENKVLIIQRDITLSKKSDLLLKNNEARYRTQFENASDAILIIKDGKFIDCNSKTLSMFNSKTEDIIGNIPARLSPEIQPDGELSTKKAKKKIDLAVSGIEQTFEWKHKKKNGELFDAIVNLNSFELDQELYIMAMVQDISDQKRTQRELIEEKDKLKVTLESISNGVITTDKSGKIILFNNIAEIILDRKDLEGKIIGDILDIKEENSNKPIIKKIDEFLIKGEKLEINGLFIGKDKSEKILTIKCVPIFESDGEIRGAVFAIDDITEKRRTEEEILNIKKIESIGILAGGIAHDFNNLLTGILGNITLSKLYLNKGRDITNKLNSAEQATIRAQELTKQFLTFSKGGTPIKETSSMIEIIEESVHFILRGSNVDAIFDIQSDLWAVDIDRGQINQVINNLIINAIHAMESGGQIIIKGTNIELNNSKIAKLKKGKYVLVSIKDKGIGIPSANLKKIFDPYFSTKTNGSGLGLASSYSIIKKHDGHIRVKSKVGVGTEFFIYLPASDKKIKKKKDDVKIKLGVGNILIMDDEEVVINILENLLTTLGFSVVSVQNGNELLEIYRLMKEAGIGFDLLMLDLTIKGGMGGEEAIKHLLKIDPKVKVIASSGYSNNPIMSDYKKYGFSGVIPKPYRIESLSTEIERVLNL